ncbi:MAG TPA: ABC transporter permease [Acidimicrobiales bacterium]|nr:ABC transporter permease [Acidimicrobiales bacterium]
MRALIARRLAALVPILLLVSFGVFLLVSLVPGDAAVTLAGGENATPESIAHVRAELHLNEPIVDQYGRWVSHAARLDFGKSLEDGASVSRALRSRIPVTLGLVIAATIVSLLVGVPLGIVSGLRPGGSADRASRLTASLGVAIPNFWLAVVLVAVFAVHYHLLPPSGYVALTDSLTGWVRHMALPAIALGLASAAALARQLRAELVDVLDATYIRTAWAKGAGARLVVGKHALKNAAIPAVTILGLQIGYLLGGAVIVEQIFALPGLGTYFIRGVLSSDLPVIQGVTVVFVLGQLVMSLLVDMSYGLLNPKVRVH